MKNDIVVVSGLPKDAAGAVVWWSMSGPTNINRLAQEWEAAGLEPKLLPTATSPEVAMRGAVVEYRKKDCLVLPIQGEKGWMIAPKEGQEGDDLHFKVQCRVKLDTWLRVEPSDHPLAPEILNSFQQRLDELSHGATSSWLVKRLYGLRAVALRESGGFYFVPRAGMEAWRKTVKAVHASSGHSLLEVPALRTDEAVHAVTVALREEVRQTVDYVKGYLENEHSERGFHSRADDCAELADKIRSYEATLGSSLVDLVEQVDNLKMRSVEAALAAGEDDE